LSKFWTFVGTPADKNKVEEEQRGDVRLSVLVPVRVGGSPTITALFPYYPMCRVMMTRKKKKKMMGETM